MDKGERSSTPFIVVAIVFFLFLQLGLYYFKLDITLNGAELIDTDTYMRLVRVEQLVNTGDWYDSTIHRNNYPYGDTLHWTRPLDVLLIAGAAPLIPFLGFKQALLQFGIIFSPLMGILSLLALLWLAKPLMAFNTQNLLLLIFVAQPLIFQIFMFGRPDHHSLLLLLFILLLGVLTHMLSSRNWPKYSILAGLLAALSTWISTEAIFAIIMVFAALVILWINNKDHYASMLRNFSLSLLLFSTLFLLIERPIIDFISAIEYDKISIVYIFVYLLGAIYAIILSTLNSNQIKTRAVWSGFLILPAIAGIGLVFPQFFQGPMAEVNPAIVPIWLNKVSEALPLFSGDYYYMISLLGPSSLVLAYFVYLYKSKAKPEIPSTLILVIVGFVIFTALTFYQIRMAYYALVIISIILALMIGMLIDSMSHLPNRLVMILRPLLIIVFILGFPALGLSASAVQEKTVANRPSLPALCEYLNNYKNNNPDVKTVLAHLDYGPQILYRTDYNIIAGPYHRNDSGILFIYEVMTSDDMEEVERMLNIRQVDLIIVAPNSSEQNIYITNSNPEAFYEKLKNNTVPEWLTKLDLPEETKESFVIYIVDI